MKDGDIVAECAIGDIIWNGKGIVKERPLGLVKVFKTSICSSLIEPEETDCYNVVQIREGRVKLTDEADSWMKNSLSDNDKYVSLHISRYDGSFYAWDNIERVGSVYDLPK